MSTDPAPSRKRRLARYFQNIKDSYTISRRSYPWVGWALLGAPLLIIGVAVLLATATGQALWYWLFIAVLLALVVDMVILSLTVRRASLTQIEGHPGAAKAALDQIGRGWYVESEPAAFNPKTRDIVWRVIGRPGIVLVVEGPTGRTQSLVADERKTLKRFLSTVPVHVIHVGAGEGQTRLADLQSTMRKLPTKPTRLTDAEISQVTKRLTSLPGRGPGIPKGIDPTKVRPDRRAMRGR
ncbi:MAG: DUF4191 domain-containing protein [Actinomyces sp.]|uniref:DUF4191 domain-containing protein n=1 Tax=Actinomyces sp. TaxID=29317 RepID=UPI0026DBD9FE|nr:DUF4191 domain-containing protein [Actinomyces sp.]MDO4242567.1 DUF4191 domain-containing protein [Actinomyces sp.]